jgi:hypothetical protein
MSSTLDQNCRALLGNREIRGRVVILCEGHPMPNEFRPKRSVGDFKKLDRQPDKNFYRRCVPRWWRDHERMEPIFFNCGSRDQVIRMYYRAKEIHNADQGRSYLTERKLFALVDLDIQSGSLIGKIAEEHTSIAELYSQLYEKGRRKKDSSFHSHFLTTGFIHKESYFVHPMAEEAIRSFPSRVYYKSAPFTHRTLFADMARDLKRDQDLKYHFERAAERLAVSDKIDTSSFHTFCQSLEREIRQNGIADPDILTALLLARKAKEYWEKRVSFDNRSKSKSLRNALVLQIAKHYSRCHYPAPPEHHIGCLFEGILSCLHN